MKDIIINIESEGLNKGIQLIREYNELVREYFFEKYPELQGQKFLYKDVDKKYWQKCRKKACKTLGIH